MSLHIPIRVYFIYFEAKIFRFRKVYEIFGRWYFSNYDTFLLVLFILNFFSVQNDYECVPGMPFLSFSP